MKQSRAAVGLTRWEARCQETTHLSGCTSIEMPDKQLTSICSRRAIYFKWHFCFLSKSTRVTWINPLHPESAPSYKATGAVCSAGAYWPVPWESCVPFPPQLLQLHKGKNSVGWLPKSRSSLPHQTKVSLASPFHHRAQNTAELFGHPGVLVAKKMVGIA